MRLLPLLTVAHAARTVKWEVKTTGRAPAPASFDAWFADSTNPVERCIVAANDAISEVNDLGGGNYEGRISGATFPLVKLQPVMEFSLTRQNPRSISISLDKQRMETTGPRWACRIVEAMAGIMDTTSTSVFTVENNELVCEASVTASFDVPRWVPVPLKSIQNGGQNAIQKQVEGDVGTMVSNLLKNDPSAPKEEEASPAP